MSADGSIAESTTSEPSPEKVSNRVHRGQRSRRKRKPSRTPKKKRDGVITSLNELAVVPDKPINESIQLLKQIMQCSAPFGLLLDMKSRHVSRRVWALVVDFLRDSGASQGQMPQRCVGLNRRKTDCREQAGQARLFARYTRGTQQRSWQTATTTHTRLARFSISRSSRSTTVPASGRRSS